MKPQSRQDSSRRRSASSRNGSEAAPRDPAGLLTSYQQTLAGLFDEFSAAASHADRRAIAGRICRLVSAQCDVEEEFLYPGAARRGGRPHDRVRAAQLEGAFVRKVVEQIRALDRDKGPDDRRFAATVGILRDYLDDYLEQQRTDVLPRLRLGSETTQLCQAMLHRRAEILASSPGAGS